MAIWQYIAYLIPANSVASDGTMIGLVITADGFEFPPLRFPVAPAELERLLSTYLPPRTSGHRDLRTWGDDARDDVDVWYDEEGVIGSVRVRLDLRSVRRERIVTLVGLARQMGCCFLEGRTFEVVSPTEDALLESIRNSRSAKFVRDPEGFLERLRGDATG